MIELAHITKAFDEARFGDVARLIQATSLGTEINSDETAELYWIAARSFYEERDYSSVLEYSVKLIDYMIRERQAIKENELFEATFNMTVNSFHQIKKRYSAFVFVSRIRNSVGDQFPSVIVVYNGILEDVASLLYHRISVVVITLGVIIAVIVRLWPGFTNLLSVVLIGSAALISILVLLGRNFIVDIIRRTLLRK